MMVDFTITQTQQFIDNAAQERDWDVTKDTEFRDALAKGLNTNVKRYGYYLCPCRDTNGTKDSDRDVICPCVYTADDIAEYGHCFCGLFLSREFAESGKEAQPIPERRPEELI